MQIASTRRATILPAHETRGGAGGYGALRDTTPSTSKSFLSMYAEPPREELTLEDFEVTAFDRLRGEAW
jgi:hypothetical protein